MVQSTGCLTAGGSIQESDQLEKEYRIMNNEPDCEWPASAVSGWLKADSRQLTADS